MTKTILKAGNLQTASNGVYSLDLRDFAQQASAMLDAARLEAQRLLEDSKRSTEQDRQQSLNAAHRQGYEEGLARGRETGHAAALEEARKQFATEQVALLSSVTSLLKGFTGAREQLFVEARQDVIVLAVNIARRLVSRLLEMGDIATDAARQSCAEALDMMGEPTEAVIRAHPDDADAIDRFCQELSAELKSSRHLRVVPDATLSRGGVIVETVDSEVNATIVEKTRRIADELVANWSTRAKELSLEP